jgi:hypothetical protein
LSSARILIQCLQIKLNCKLTLNAIKPIVVGKSL